MKNVRPSLATPAHEHEFEAAHGLPEALPAGERLLWQGAPDWRLLARDAFHVRQLAAYFSAILVARLGFQLSEGASVADAVVGTMPLVPLVAAAIGMAVLTAWLVARTSVYTITDQRIVLRIGIVLSLTFNLPLRCIRSADLRRLGAHSGDIVLGLDDTAQIAYVHLWPHARPWHVRRTQPMLRALPEANAIAAVLAGAWTACLPLDARPVATAASSAPAISPATGAALRRPARQVPQTTYAGATATGR